MGRGMCRHLRTYLHRGKPRCHREVYLFATRSSLLSPASSLHSLLAQPSMPAEGLPCWPQGHPCERRPSALRSAPSVPKPPCTPPPPRLAKGVVPSTPTRSRVPRSGRRNERLRPLLTPLVAFDPLRRFSLGGKPRCSGGVLVLCFCVVTALLQLHGRGGEARGGFPRFGMAAAGGSRTRVRTTSGSREEVATTPNESPASKGAIPRRTLGNQATRTMVFAFPTFFPSILMSSLPLQWKSARNQ